MQDIVFYAVANETLGSVRDYANARKRPAPILTLGVSVCLRMRLFAAQNDATPYPIDSFSGIVDWQWRMDDDLDRNTTCKLVADADSISVHTANGVFDGSTLHFTEFVIPISNMNTQELATWIGNGKKRSGLTGELVGYDNAGNAVFVLQIENFTIRNRVAGLGNPSAMDQEVVTRTQAESLIQAAVSVSADTKQDKLNSSNAGTGISISSNGVISTSNVPQSAVTGLSASLAAKQDNISAGDLVEISGTTVNRKRYMNIIADSSIITRTITPEGSQTSVSAYVLEPGNAYKINVTSSAKWLASTAAFKDSTGTWGIEGHIELFVAGTGYVRTDSNVILADALEPDAVNNCTLRFHDGKCIISVEDHVYGYIVVSASGTSAGSLYYGLATATQEYVAFDASLNGQTLDLVGATTYAGEKHVVGNGYTETILSGGIVCTSKTTFSNLSMDGVINSGGTMTLGDVNIPNGATVSVSGGGLAVEKVVGDGGTIDLGGTRVVLRTAGQSAFASGCVFNGGSANYGGAFAIDGGASAEFVGCTFTGNKASAGGALFVNDAASVLNLSSCTISGNTATVLFPGFYAQNALSTYVKDCTIADPCGYISATVTFGGTNKCTSFFKTADVSLGSVFIESGAVLDLTGNPGSGTSGLVMNTGKGITFAPGGATVYPSAGQASAYMLGGMTVPKIGNTNVVNLGGTSINLNLSTTNGSGVTFTNGVTAFSAQQNVFGSFMDCVFSGNVGTIDGANTVGGAFSLIPNDNFVFSGCTFSNTATHGADVYANGYGTNKYIVVDFKDCNLLSPQSRSIYGYGESEIRFGGTCKFLGAYLNYQNTGKCTISSGAILDLTGNTNSTPINPGGGITFVSGGNKMIRYGSGTSSGTRVFEDVEIRGASISNQGIIYGATVYFPESHGPLDVWYTTDSGTTSSSVQISGGTPAFVVDGGLVSVES